MKGEGLLECLKRDRRTKNKWIKAHKARETCGYGGGYVRKALERFAEELPEVDKKEECKCTTLYYIDPPETEVDNPLLEEMRQEVRARFHRLQFEATLNKLNDLCECERACSMG